MGSTDKVKKILSDIEISLEEELKEAESTRTNLGYGEEFHKEIENVASRHGVNKKDILDAAVLLIQEVLGSSVEAREVAIEKIKERRTSDFERKSYAISSITRSKALEMANQLGVSRKHLIGVGVGFVEIYARLRDEAFRQ